MPYSLVGNLIQSIILHLLPTRARVRLNTTFRDLQKTVRQCFLLVTDITTFKIKVSALIYSKVSLQYCIPFKMKSSRIKVENLKCFKRQTNLHSLTCHIVIIGVKLLNDYCCYNISTPLFPLTPPSIMLSAPPVFVFHLSNHESR